MNWYYAKGTETRGPVGDTQFRAAIESGMIGPEDRVWRPGWTAWRRAGDIEGLFTPPPLTECGKGSEDMHCTDSGGTEYPGAPSRPEVAAGAEASVPLHPTIGSHEPHSSVLSCAIPTKLLPTRWLTFHACVRLPLGGLICLGNAIHAPSPWIGLLLIAYSFFAVVLAFGIVGRRYWAWLLNWLVLLAEFFACAARMYYGRPAGPPAEPLVGCLLVLLFTIFWCVPNSVYFWKRRILFS